MIQMYVYAQAEHEFRVELTQPVTVYNAKISFYCVLQILEARDSSV
jgi:hypothetical protein